MDVLGSERIGLRTLLVQIVRSVAKQHGGSVNVDPQQQRIWIKVPPEQRAMCAQEVAKQLNAMQEYLSKSFLIFFVSKIVMPNSNN